ncbi:hypothetical protein E2C01_003552 [Portunus trituberculatus]|uniref:Uncharacterized protein n=1 Tax=Portunus trituberculatus TaxID=210409 RepID=A0A5B7CMQ3_PORTR|nr:hypothetical protein [Portunus trituberculatus]
MNPDLWPTPMPFSYQSPYLQNVLEVRTGCWPGPGGEEQVYDGEASGGPSMVVTRGEVKRYVRGDLTHPPNLPRKFHLGREWQRRLT